MQQVVLLARKLGDFFSFNISQFTLDENPIQLKLFRCKLYFVIALFEKKKKKKSEMLWNVCPFGQNVREIVELVGSAAAGFKEVFQSL